MEFSKHALDKLEIYGIPDTELSNVLNDFIFEFFDLEELSLIRIINLKEMYFAIVISTVNNKIVTIYRTDLHTVNKRRESGRWILQ